MIAVAAFRKCIPLITKPKSNSNQGTRGIFRRIGSRCPASAATIKSESMIAYSQQAECHGPF